MTKEGDHQVSHRVPGEALSRRLNAREYRRPKLGFEPSFYARWGLEDPWLNLSDTSWKWADPLSVDDGWSYLSDRAYQQHLARLGFQRWSRQDRYAQWFSDHAERMLGMVERRSGQPSPGRKHSHGMVRRLCIIWRRSQTLSPKRPRNPKSKHEPFDRWADPLQGFHFHGANPKRW